LQLGHRADDFSSCILEPLLQILNLGIARQQLELETCGALFGVGVLHVDGHGLTHDFDRGRRSRFGLRARGCDGRECKNNQGIAHEQILVGCRIVEPGEAPDPLSPVTNERAKGNIAGGGRREEGRGKREEGRGKREEGGGRRKQFYGEENREKGVDPFDLGVDHG